ncbi:hypothetical protein HBO19_22675 [Pseudomonas sp. WS 5021]|uniref:hypothetical protein n=1 Tax=Pseudomonas sp. WS 5021 TaxID=2717490 RepID=UPI00147648FC|nr:hypothetical protein [Pseudomonas sp. WS 5021]NMY28785.1 hypothetical protein [Pseudomonas sp. WS 5021]
MNIRWGLFALAWVAPLAWAEVPAKLFYSSQADFTEMTLTLKKAQALQPELIEVDVTLTPQARARTKTLTQSALHKQMTLYLNGRPLNTVTVQGVIDGPGLRFSIPRNQLLEMMPSLLK